jgi:hypothetical protein
MICSLNILFNLSVSEATPNSKITGAYCTGIFFKMQVVDFMAKSLESDPEILLLHSFTVPGPVLIHKAIRKTYKKIKITILFNWN